MIPFVDITLTIRGSGVSASSSAFANALNIEVYQLFIPKNHNPIKIEETPQNQNIYNQIQKQVIEDVRKSITRTLDKWEKEV